MLQPFDYESDSLSIRLITIMTSPLLLLVNYSDYVDIIKSIIIYIFNYAFFILLLC